VSEGRVVRVTGFARGKRIANLHSRYTHYRGPTRLERDLLGEKAVPADAYFGVQTVGLDNFDIRGMVLHLYPDLIRDLALSAS
jgi:hypothetical protein